MTEADVQHLLAEKKIRAGAPDPETARVEVDVARRHIASAEKIMADDSTLAFTAIGQSSIPRRAASSNGVSWNGSSFRRRSSRATVGLRRPSTSGRATEALTGVTSSSHSADRAGVRTGTSMMRGRPTQESRDPLDHLSIGHHLGPTGVERLAAGGVFARHSGQIARNVVERDRLRQCRDPARRDHHGEPLHQAKDRPEGGAALPDHHGRAQCRHGHPVRGQSLTRLAAAVRTHRSSPPSPPR